jgi:hypothetical protein
MRIAVVGLAALAVTVAGGGSGAKADVRSPDAAALTAADGYIQSGRGARARVHIDGAVAGTPVRARLTRHAFHFGINVTGTFNRFLIEARRRSPMLGVSSASCSITSTPSYRRTPASGSTTRASASS